MERTQFLLKYGSNVKAMDARKWTPLHHASFGGHLDVAKLLEEKGPDLDAKEIDEMLDDTLSESSVSIASNHRGVSSYITDNPIEQARSCGFGVTPFARNCPIPSRPGTRTSKHVTEVLTRSGVHGSHEINNEEPERAIIVSAPLVAGDYGAGLS